MIWGEEKFEVNKILLKINFGSKTIWKKIFVKKNFGQKYHWIQKKMNKNEYNLKMKTSQKE